MGNARQHQEQGQLGEPAVTERGAQTQSVSDLLERQSANSRPKTRPSWA
jgi:hypothetical protein